jgi:hypothetical protein
MYSVVRRGFGGTWCLSVHPPNRRRRLRVVACQTTLRLTPDDHHLHATICIPSSENDIFHLFTVYLSNLSVPQTKATGWTPPSGCQGAHLPTVFIHIQISVNWSSQRLRTVKPCQSSLYWLHMRMSSHCKNILQILPNTDILRANDAILNPDHQSWQHVVDIHCALSQHQERERCVSVLLVVTPLRSVSVSPTSPSIFNFFSPLPLLQRLRDLYYLFLLQLHTKLLLLFLPTLSYYFLFLIYTFSLLFSISFSSSRVLISFCYTNVHLFFFDLFLICFFHHSYTLFFLLSSSVSFFFFSCSTFLPLYQCPFFLLRLVLHLPSIIAILFSSSYRSSCSFCSANAHSFSPVAFLLLEQTYIFLVYALFECRIQDNPSNPNATRSHKPFTQHSQSSD